MHSSCNGIYIIQHKNSRNVNIEEKEKLNNKGNNKITELRTILQRESQNS